jgi:hypothetical protein
MTRQLRLTRYIPHEPHAPQIAFLALDEREAFYGGAAGGGKSDALLMAALQYVDIPGYAALILRRTFAELDQPDAIMARSREWLASTDARWNEQKKRWTFPSGATLTFGYCKAEKDIYQYQGAAYHFVGWDELTQFSEMQYTYLFSRQRRPAEGDAGDVPLRMRSASNPGGIGHAWVKKRFITQRKPGTVFIPAKLDDNPSLDRETYIEGLNELPEVTRRQLLDGDWGAFEGAAYPELSDLHLVDTFDLPDSFGRFESMDHGVTNPTAWLLYATDYDGNTIVADEYYAPGLPDEHAAEVKRRRSDWWEAKDEDGWPQKHPCHGDPASLREALPEKNDFGEPLTLQEIYQRHGLRIIPGNNRRRAGFVAVRELLKPDPTRRFPLWHPNAGDLGAPRLFVMGGRCPELVEQLRNAPLAIEETDPERGEAVDRRWESAYGHAHAALRYGITTRPTASSEPQQKTEDPRRALLERRRARTRKPKSRFVDV